MTPQEFVNKYYPHAKKVEDRTGISAIAILAQAALESSWGAKAVGNALFGIKDTDGINGNEQLITTTEYLSSPHVHFPKILSITPYTDKKGKLMYKYLVQDYFRKYDSPEDSLNDHAKFIQDNPRYAKALKVKSDPYAFVSELALAGYATAANYGEILKQMVDSIKRRLPIV
jgi:flagellum-specific peptidoglycan hydrolase FlgJ